MNFENSWYLIERDGRHEILSHANFTKLSGTEYVLLENFETRHEALIEYQRIVKLDIEDASNKINDTNSASKRNTHQ
jgi:hypothetical protein